MTQNIWIVTIGSSDVQLTSDDLWWNSWCPEIEHELHGNSFEPSKTEQITWGESREESEKITYRLPARVLGLAYNALPDKVGKYLTFPLLEKFAKQLKVEQVTLTKIVVILTDQEEFFIDDDKERDACPYWQDTCLLKQALTDCFFGCDDYGLKGVKIEWIALSPQYEDGEKYGLDHWNQVLDLVKTKIREFKKKQELELKPGDRVYVSHQAGTPALSSAVQFVCLAEFEKQFQVDEEKHQQTVRFLVSNEYGSPTKPIQSSEYLRGIRKQEALALLKRHDYSGIKALIGYYLKPYEQLLLDTAVQWNYAEFGKFSDFIKGQSIPTQYPNSAIQEFQEKYPKLVEVIQDRTKEENWWWEAYEAAYLGIVRLVKQSNNVEAMFHSFRAVEGLTKNWALHTYSLQIQYSNLAQPNTPYFHGTNLPNKLQSWFNTNRHRRYNNVGLFGKPLFDLLKASEQSRWNQCPDIQNFTSVTLGERNSTFHGLRGLQRLDLYNAWGTQRLEDWETRVLGCLNFIAQPQPAFKLLAEASLMVKVHEELERAIDVL